MPATGSVHTALVALTPAVDEAPKKHWVPPVVVPLCLLSPLAAAVLAPEEDILWQTLQEEYDALHREILERYAEEQSPRLEHLIWIRMFEKAAEQRPLYRVMIGSRGSALLTERIQTYLVGLAEAGIRDGQFLPGNTLDPRFVAEYMIGALVRCSSWWLEDPGDRTPQQMADTFYRLFFHREPEGLSGASRQDTPLK